MALSHSVKERTISENSLVILLQGLQGQVTTVDLRDESVARGRIDNVDAFMNIRLANVTYTDRRGHQVELDDLFVTGRNVRYVHIPDGVNITATIEQQLAIIHRVRNFGGRGRREFSSKRSWRRRSHGRRRRRRRLWRLRWEAAVSGSHAPGRPGPPGRSAEQPRLRAADYGRAALITRESFSPDLESDLEVRTSPQGQPAKAFLLERSPVGTDTIPAGEFSHPGRRSGCWRKEEDDSRLK
ncbi:U7 snRNA-associated Sm-like protein LSm10 [Acomys russatus]|uniref:U7 snRNA-associated Sm-like protein LSm10 n=1 Tax=Acomys russatus TaxID=60746 RepID=UPI0021E28A2D|nr:U7 snRNA-associated Sm-like protein LSm10 [Acomys russatus]